MPPRTARRRPRLMARPAGALAVSMFCLVLVSLNGCSSPSSSASSAPARSGIQSPDRTSARPSPGAGRPLSVVVAQSAEHTANGTDDPPLSLVGTARAKRLALLLADRPGVAVFVNQYQRTQSTGLPTARKWNVAPSLYDATQPAGQVEATVRAQYRGGEVLLVGQHDTVPALAEAFCDCSVNELPAGDFSTLFRIDFDVRTGKPTPARQSDH